MLSVSKGPAPDCLSGFSAYTELRGPCQQEVRDQLSAEQHGYCAYCERVFSESAQSELTVAHQAAEPLPCAPGRLVQSHRVVQSPGDLQPSQGGKYSEQFIDPVRERPADFLELLPISGDVLPRKALCGHCRNRAEYTLNVLNLNQKHLTYSRREACARVGEASLYGVQPAEYLNETLGYTDFVPMMRTVFVVDEAALGPECPGCGRANP